MPTYHFTVHHEGSVADRFEDIEASCESEARDLAMLRLLFGQHVTTVEVEADGEPGFRVEREEPPQPETRRTAAVRPWMRWPRS